MHRLPRWLVLGSAALNEADVTRGVFGTIQRCRRSSAIQGFIQGFLSAGHQRASSHAHHLS